MITKNDKNEGQVTKNISYILQFIDTNTMIINVKFEELNINIFSGFLNTETLKII